MSRVISDLKISLLRVSDNKRLSFGEGFDFDIWLPDGIKGLGKPKMITEYSDVISGGAIKKSARLDKRTVDFTTHWNTAEQLRILLDFFQPNAQFYATIYFNGTKYYQYCNEGDQIDWDGSAGFLHSGADVPISLVFPNPYLYTDKTYNHSIGFEIETKTSFNKGIKPVGAGKFSFSQVKEPQEYIINNPNSTPNGIEIDIIANRTVLNPTIINYTTDEILKFNVELLSGWSIYVNTEMGEIRAYKIDPRGVATDIIKDTTLDSKFIQLVNGDNKLLFTADENAVSGTCRIKFRQRVVGAGASVGGGGIR